MIKKILTVTPLVAVLFAAVSCGAKNMNEERMSASPHFKEGLAVNFEPIPLKIDSDQSTLSLMWELFVTSPRPEKPIPSQRTDLLLLDSAEEMLVWLGHSSLLLQTGGKRILVDPVLSEAGSPVPFANVPFDGTKLYTAKDIPEVDYLIITHDHYDHLSKKTIKAIRDRVGKVFCPLGVGKYLKDWGYPEDKIIEMDWNENYDDGAGFKVYCLTSRHFSGRSLWGRNSTLWASFLLETPERKIYFSGDSGYGKHFKEFGERFGVVDLAFMENGQYDKRWKYAHMLPEETLAAGADINAKFMMPIHNSKYKLSAHAWNDPLKSVTSLLKKEDMVLMTPMIGEKVPLWNESYEYKRWWEETKTEK